MNQPLGTWAWIWNLWNIFGGDVDSIVSFAKAKNLSGVMVKTNDGEWDWMRRNKVAELVVKGHAAGLGVAGWGYSVGDWEGPAIGFDGGDYHICTVADEVSLVKKAMDTGIDFYVLDAEMEWASNNRRPDPLAHARKYIDYMRHAVGTFSVGFSNAPRANMGFAGYPIGYMANPKFFDFWIPQNYVFGWGVPGQLDLWTQRGAGIITDTAMPPLMGGLPVYPAYDVNDAQGGSISAADVHAATASALKYGAKGISWWQWEAMTREQWNAVADSAVLFSAAPSQLPLPENDSTNPAVWHCAITDTWVVEPAFLDYYQSFKGKGLELFGLPWQGMIVAPDGRKVQTFERARFELNPDGSVVLGRLGAELYPKS